MKTDLKSEIGLRVKAARARSGVTQESLAEAVQRTVETISKIERGVAFPGMDTLETIAIALNTPIREFFPDNRKGERSARRTELELQGNDLLQALADGDLEIAIGQIKLLVRSPTRRR